MTPPSPRLTLIAALDQQRGIGVGGRLPWRLPDDLKRFKQLTHGKTLLMGRKTAESLGRALPGRRNLVLTRSGAAPYVGMQVVASLDAALSQVSDELIVIGGGEIYALCIAQAEALHLTLVDTWVTAADVFFPELIAAEWRETARIAHPADAQHAQAFAFVDLQRLRK